MQRGAASGSLTPSVERETREQQQWLRCCKEGFGRGRPPHLGTDVDRGEQTDGGRGDTRGVETKRDSPRAGDGGRGPISSRFEMAGS